MLLAYNSSTRFSLGGTTDIRDLHVAMSVFRHPGEIDPPGLRKTSLGVVTARHNVAHHSKKNILSCSYDIINFHGYARSGYIGARDYLPFEKLGGVDFGKGIIRPKDKKT